MAVSNLTDGTTLLRNSWPALSRGILRGEYAFWLGSGISRSKFPDLSSLIMLVLTGLYTSIDAANPNCPRKKALENIIKLTYITDLPITEHPDTWPAARKSELLQVLQEKYADVLEQNFNLPTGIYSITRDLLHLEQLYGNPAVTPDAEHRFVALLIEEGILRDLLTTNWDALLELAHEDCRNPKPGTLQSVASANEWNRNGFISRLVKIHGCARKVRANAAVYRPYLIATRSDIRAWTARPEYEPFQTAFKTTLREKTAFFVGLSAQDWNIQAQCEQAASGQAPFPATPPKVYFAEEELKLSQRAIMRAIYGPTAYEADSQNIDTQAMVPMYAKTLLGSLYLLTVQDKIELILSADNPLLTAECRLLMSAILQQVKSEVLLKFDGIVSENIRWQSVADQIPYFISRTLGMFRRRLPPANRNAYEPIGEKHLGQMEQALHELTELQWLAFALVVLRDGLNKSFWQLEVPVLIDGNQGQLRLGNGATTVPVFLLRDDTGLPSLMASGFIDAAAPDRNIIIYPGERRPTKRRTTSPSRSLPGSIKVKEPNEIWLRGELEEVTSLAELFDNIKPVVGLALAT